MGQALWVKPSLGDGDTKIVKTQYFTGGVGGVMGLQELLMAK